MTAPRRVTIVMYHFVRPADARPSGLNALALDAFAGQLAYVRRHYSPVTLQDVVSAARGRTVLPPRPIVLTFDDGYVDHYRYVYPLLRAAATPATFFPVASAMLRRHVLAVNKIHLLLATVGAERLIPEIDSAANRTGPAAVEAYRKAWWKPLKFDPAPVTYVKRMLQVALPEEVREPLLDALFSEHVSRDEAATADSLYMTKEQVAEMAGGGMEIGAHADRHVRLTALAAGEQAREIDGALAVLPAIGLPRTDFVYSYANGEYDENSVALLRERGCAAAVTTRRDVGEIAGDALLTLPRLDTKDLPTDRDAPVCPWTGRADDPPTA